MENEYWIGSLITTVVGALVGFLLGRRKYNKEVDNIAITNMQQSLDFYQKLSDDTSQRLEVVLEENTKLRDELQRLRSENVQLKTEMKELREMVEKLTGTLANYGLNRMLEDAGSSSGSRKISEDGEGEETKATETKENSRKAKAVKS